MRRRPDHGLGLRIIRSWGIDGAGNTRATQSAGTNNTPFAAKAPYVQFLACNSFSSLTRLKSVNISSTLAKWFKARFAACLTQGRGVQVAQFNTGANASQLVFSGVITGSEGPPRIESCMGQSIRRRPAFGRRRCDRSRLGYFGQRRADWSGTYCCHRYAFNHSTRVAGCRQSIDCILKFFGGP